MRKRLLTILILIASQITIAQIQGIVKDIETKKTIPFVNIWVENENIGTTSNDIGEFELSNTDRSMTIIFSAIGYDVKKINGNSINDEIQLKPIVTELEEVEINSRKEEIRRNIGAFKKSRINHYFACGKLPWITARYFEYRNDYIETPLIKNITVLTNSEIKNSKFQVRLYEKDKDGKPGNLISRNNIIGIAKKGKKLNEIDISKHNIRFPEEGLYIAIEWLIINENRHEYSYNMNNSKKKSIGISFEPAFGTIKTKTDENSWIFNQGEWRKVWKNVQDDSYNILAIKLELSN